MGLTSKELKQKLKNNIAKFVDCHCEVVNIKDNEDYDVYIGRPSKWGNPYSHINDGTTLAKYITKNREEAIESYREWIEGGAGKHLLSDLHELKGKTLGCWCKPQSCHGDILAELVLKYCK